MIKILRIVFILLFLATPALAELGLGDLYSDSELQDSKQRSSDNIQWNFDNLILGKLTPAERLKLGPVRLAFPLRGPGILRNHPLQFFASGQTITMPVLSFHFFDELTQAWAYLLCNNLDMQLLGDYLAMLKYRDPAQFPNGRFPGPLEALDIAKDAWKNDPKMDDISQKALKSAIVWIMAHEIAHIYYQHPGYGPGITRTQAQRNEAQADQFANKIMRRIGVAPVGIVQFFMAMAHLDRGRGDFSSNQAWQKYLGTEATHPLTANRLKVLASDLRQSPQDFTTQERDQQSSIQRVYYIANQIDGISTTLEDPDMHRLIAAIGLSTDLNSLRNRQRKFSSTDPSICVGKTAGADMHGTHQGIYTRNLKNGSKEWLSATMTLERTQNRVRGRFFFGAGEGTIQGVISKGKRIFYDWQWGSASGKGELTIDDTGALSGEWGYNDNPAGGGSWTLCQK